MDKLDELIEMAENTYIADHGGPLIAAKDELATLRADLRDAVAMLKRLERTKMDGYTYGACAVCLYPYHSHAPDCELAALLARLSHYEDEFKE